MKCVKCGNVFTEGVFCPECGYKYDPEEAKAEEERLEKERLEKERIAKEKAAEEARIAREKLEKERALAEAQAKAEQMEKERLEQERLAREQEERDRKAKQQEEKNRLEREQNERKRQEEQNRRDCTYNGVVYPTKEHAKLAKAENEKIDLLKIKLEGTQSQTERQKIMGDFQEDIQTMEVKQRLELLRGKVNQSVPGAEKNNKWVGWISLVAFIASVIVCMTCYEYDTVLNFAALVMVIAIIGGIVWLVRKILISIRKKTKDYYLNIKDI